MSEGETQEMDLRGTLRESCIILGEFASTLGCREVGVRRIDEIHSDPDRKWKPETSRKGRKASEDRCCERMNGY